MTAPSQSALALDTRVHLSAEAMFTLSSVLVHVAAVIPHLSSLVRDSAALRDMEGVLSFLVVLLQSSGSHLLLTLREWVEEAVLSQVRMRNSYASAQFCTSLVDGQIVAETFKSQPPMVKVAIEQTHAHPSGCNSWKDTVWVLGEGKLLLLSRLVYTGE